MHIVNKMYVPTGYNTPNADVRLPFLLRELKFARFKDSKITYRNVLYHNVVYPLAQWTN